MALTIDEVTGVLARTPAVLDALLRGLPAEWTGATEGEGTWSPFDVVGHLIHGERTDWMPRVRHILEQGEGRPFERFDRSAHLEAGRGKTLGQLLDGFATLRAENLAALRVLHLTDAELERRGLHPDLGAVTLGQLLATWVAHDLNHLIQISRVMARRLKADCGPWTAYLRVLQG